MAVADVFETITYFNDSAERGACVLHWAQTGGTIPNADPYVIATNLAEFVQEKFSDVWAFHANSDAFVTCTLANRISPANGPVGNDFTAQAGGLTSESPPAQVALVLSKYTNLYGKSYRGRNYIPFIADSQHDDGQLKQSYVTATQTYWNALYVGTKSIGTGQQEVFCGIYSRELNQINAVTNLIIRPVLRTQRRRVQPRQGYSS